MFACCFSGVWSGIVGIFGYMYEFWRTARAKVVVDHVSVILCVFGAFCYAVANWSSGGSVCICWQDGWPLLSLCTLEKWKPKVKTVLVVISQHFDLFARMSCIVSAPINVIMNIAVTWECFLPFFIHHCYYFLFCLLSLLPNLVLFAAGDFFLLTDSGLSSFREAK